MAPTPGDTADASVALALALGGLRVSSSAAPPKTEALLLTIESGDSGSDSSVCLSIRPRDSARSATALSVSDNAIVRAHKSPYGEHVERPERVAAVYDALRSGGFSAHTLTVPPRLANREEVALVHEKNHWDRIEWAVSQEITELDAFVAEHESLYLARSSLDAARYSAGAVLEVCEAVMSGRARNGMALVRPPGHHAEAHTAMGFCVLNTVAITAQHAREQLGCKR